MSDGDEIFSKPVTAENNGKGAERKEGEHTSSSPDSGNEKQKGSLAEEYSKASLAVLTSARFTETLQSLFVPLVTLTYFEDQKPTDAEMIQLVTDPAELARLEKKSQDKTKTLTIPEKRALAKAQDLIKLEKQFQGGNLPDPTKEQDLLRLAKGIYENLHNGGSDGKGIGYLCRPKNGMIAEKTEWDGQKIKMIHFHSVNANKTDRLTHNKFLAGDRSKYFIDRYLTSRQLLIATGMQDGLENDLHAADEKLNLLARLEKGQTAPHVFDDSTTVTPSTRSDSANTETSTGQPVADASISTPDMYADLVKEIAGKPEAAATQAIKQFILENAANNAGENFDFDTTDMAQKLRFQAIIKEDAEKVKAALTADKTFDPALKGKYITLSDRIANEFKPAEQTPAKYIEDNGFNLPKPETKQDDYTNLAGRIAGKSEAEAIKEIKVFIVQRALNNADRDKVDVENTNSPKRQQDNASFQRLLKAESDEVTKALNANSSMDAATKGKYIALSNGITNNFSVNGGLTPRQYIGDKLGLKTHRPGDGKSGLLVDLYNATLGTTFSAWGALDRETAKLFPDSGWASYLSGLRYPAIAAAYYYANRAFAAGVFTDAGGKLNWLIRGLSAPAWVHTEPIRAVDATAAAIGRRIFSRDLNWVNGPILRSRPFISNWLDNKHFTELAEARQEGRKPSAQVLIMLNNVYNKFETNPQGRNGSLHSPNKVTWGNFYNAMRNEYRSWNFGSWDFGSWNFGSWDFGSWNFVGGSWFTPEAKMLAQAELKKVKSLSNSKTAISETPKTFCLKTARAAIMEEVPDSVADHESLRQYLIDRANRSAKGQLLEKEACVTLIGDSELKQHHGTSVGEFKREFNADLEALTDTSYDRYSRSDTSRALDAHGQFAKDFISVDKLKGVADPQRINRLFNQARKIIFEKAIELTKNEGSSFWEYKSASARDAPKVDPKKTFLNILKAQTEKMMGELGAVENDHNTAIIGQLAEKLTQSRKNFQATVTATPDKSLYDLVKDTGYKPPDLSEEDPADDVEEEHAATREISRPPDSTSPRRDARADLERSLAAAANNGFEPLCDELIAQVHERARVECEILRKRGAIFTTNNEDANRVYLGNLRANFGNISTTLNRLVQRGTAGVDADEVERALDFVEGAIIKRQEVRLADGTANVAQLLNENGRPFDSAPLRAPEPPPPLIPSNRGTGSTDHSAPVPPSSGSGDNAVRAAGNAGAPTAGHTDLDRTVANGLFMQDGALLNDFRSNVEVLVNDDPEIKESDIEALVETSAAGDGIPEGRLSNVTVQFSGNKGSTLVELSFHALGDQPGHLTVLQNPIWIKGNDFVGKIAQGGEVRVPTQDVHKSIIIGVDPKDLNSTDSAVKESSRRTVLTSVHSALNSLTLDAEAFEAYNFDQFFNSGRIAAEDHLPTAVSNEPAPATTAGTLVETENAPLRTAAELDNQARLAEAERPRLVLQKGTLALRTSSGEIITKTNKIIREIRNAFNEEIVAATDAKDLDRVTALEAKLEEFKTDSEAFLETIKRDLTPGGKYGGKATEGMEVKKLLGIAGVTVGVLMLGNAALQASEKTSENKARQTPHLKSDEDEKRKSDEDKK